MSARWRSSSVVDPGASLWLAGAQRVGVSGGHVATVPLFPSLGFIRFG